jgi:hypothetical protein
MDESEIKYVRKLSGEEALKRFIIIPKESLSLFPKPGLPFKMMIEGQEIDCQVKLNDVRTQGSRKGAHEYRIDLSKHIAQFRPRFEQTVVIEKKQDVYSLRII